MKRRLRRLRSWLLGGSEWEHTLEWYARVAGRRAGKEFDRLVFGEGPPKEFTGLRTIIDDTLPAGKAYLLNLDHIWRGPVLSECAFSSGECETGQCTGACAYHPAWDDHDLHLREARRYTAIVEGSITRIIDRNRQAKITEIETA